MFSCVIKPFVLQEALQALNFMASGGGMPHPLLPPPVHSPLHPLHSPNHFPGLSSLHKPHMAPNSTSSPNYSGEYNFHFLFLINQVRISMLR